MLLFLIESLFRLGLEGRDFFKDLDGSEVRVACRHKQVHTLAYIGACTREVCLPQIHAWTTLARSLAHLLARSLLSLLSWFLCSLCTLCTLALSFFLCLSLSLYLSLTLCLSLTLSLSLYAHRRLFRCGIICLSIHLFVHLFIYLSIYPYVCANICNIATDSQI